MSERWKRFALLGELDEASRQLVAEELEELDLDTGTRLFDVGDAGDALFFVDEGCVRVTTELAAEAGEFGPGSAFGALALVTGGSRQVRAETASRARILRLDRSAYQRLRRSEPGAACRLLEAILRESARLAREALVEDAPSVDRAGDAD